MKRLFLLLCFLASVSHANPITLDLHQVALPDLVRLVYGEILKRSFVLDAAVLEDTAPFTVSLVDVPKDRLDAEVLKLIEAHGFVASSVRGLLHVGRKLDQPADKQILVYRPLHRSTQYLLDLVSSLFEAGSFTTQARASSIGFNQVQGAGQGGIPPGNSPLINQGVNQNTRPDVDVLVFKGVQSDVDRLRQVLQQVDQPSGEMLVKAIVYEVQSKQREGSAVDLAVSLVSGKLGLQLAGGAAAAGGQAALRLVNSKVDIGAIYAAISSDDRFKQVTSPRLRIRSGGSAKIAVGNQTPVLGSVSYDNQGKPIQSIEYKQSGVIFELKPEVRDETILLDVKQQLSQFVPTTNGVNTTPTLNTRELSTQVSAKSGEIILIGGLDDDRASGSDSGLSFLPSWLRASQSDQHKTEIVLMLQLERI